MKKNILLCIYAVMFIFTFGHFVASDRCSGNYPNGDPRREACVFVGPFVSAAWPLYWSYEVQK